MTCRGTYAVAWPLADMYVSKGKQRCRMCILKSAVTYDHMLLYSTICNMKTVYFETQKLTLKTDYLAEQLNVFYAYLGKFNDVRKQHKTMTHKTSSLKKHTCDMKYMAYVLK